MERFWQIKSKKNDSKFFSMEDFNNAIKKKKSNDQRLFSPFKESLDFFYLCLLIGLKYNVKGNTDDYELGELTDEWTKDLSENSNAKDYIIALYLTVITKNTQNDKSKIKLILNKTLDSKKKTSLSKDGLREIHEYSFGGYEKIIKTFNNEAPSSIVSFFSKYKQLLDKSD